MKKVGYIRVSTNGQNLARQKVQAMKDTGLTKPTFYSLVKRYENR